MNLVTSKLAVCDRYSFETPVHHGADITFPAEQTKSHQKPHRKKMRWRIPGLWGPALMLMLVSGASLQASVIEFTSGPTTTSNGLSTVARLSSGSVIGPDSRFDEGVFLSFTVVQVKS